MQTKLFQLATKARQPVLASLRTLQHPVRFHGNKGHTHMELEIDNSGFRDFVNSSAAENQANTPADEDFYMADRVPDQEHSLILGLNEFEQSVRLFHERKFAESEQYLKEALGIIKRANQEESLGYLYLLKRLAFVCFQSRKYAEAEKYFRVAAELVPSCTKNPVNIFNTQKNLLLLFTHSDISKAVSYAERMLKDSDEFLPLQNKELTFMAANANFLAGNHDQAKSMYRHVLKQAPKPQLEAQVLNNLAFCSWMHVLQLKGDVDESTKARILKDEGFTMSYLKQSVEINEKAGNSAVDQTLLEELLTLELNEREPLSETQEEAFFELLQAEGNGKAITNLAEYLLMTQAMKGEIRTAAFWFRCGLKYFERVAPSEIERHLIMLGLFYASREKRMMAEGLYRQVLDKLDHDKSTQAVNYNLVMALNFYGRMLLFNPKREPEAKSYLAQSEELAKQMPHWWDKLDNLYLGDFDLD